MAEPRGTADASNVNVRCLGPLTLVLLLCANALSEPSSEEAAFFFEKVLPVLRQRCFDCHSHDKKIKGGLALDSREAWQAGGDTGKVIQPGDAKNSLLIRAIEYLESDYEMPPKGKLADSEIAVLREWVQRGAPDPRSSGHVVTKKSIDLEQGRKFWIFQPLSKQEPPPVQHRAWPVRESDFFVLAKLEQKNLTPAPDTAPARFLRRLSYDLTGLPPGEEETREFIQSASQDFQSAIERAADRLLGSLAFGEKWGRHWLDLARYADSNGSSFNPPFPQAWRYRNWVIGAHNADLPYPDFIAKQLAGDLLPVKSQQERDDNLIATGYLMLGSKVLGEFDKEQLTMDVVDEQIDTIGKSMLGLTLGCARCHDHKFDPVSQRDYYALAGIFTSTVTLQDRLGGPKEDESDWSRRGLAGRDERLQAFLAQDRYAWVKTANKRYEAANKVLELECKLAALESPGADANKPIDEKNTDAKLKAELEKARADFTEHAKKLAELETRMPVYAEAVNEVSHPADTQLRIRGVPSSKADNIPRGFLQVASWSGQPKVNPEQSGRLELAQWIGAPENPLTARVFVNRVWQHLFSEGLVRSVDNFGPRGDAPSHPELLDYLAQRFIAGGWKLKGLIREIVTSHAYRMSTHFEPAAASIDPENRLLWRQNTRRLEPEEIRDTLLLLGGQLDRSPAESLLSHLPLKDLQGGDAKHMEVHDTRRTIYQPIIRTMEADVLQIFDFPPSAMTSGERPKTTVAPQALYFLNAPFVQDCAKGFATTLQPHLEGVNIQPVVREAFTRAIGRPPLPSEARLLSAYLIKQFEGPPGPTRHDLAKLCQAIFGSTQFQFLD